MRPSRSKYVLGRGNTLRGGLTPGEPGHYAHFQSIGAGLIPGLRPDSVATRAHGAPSNRLGTAMTATDSTFVLGGGGGFGGATHGWMEEGNTVQKLARNSQSKPSQMKFIGE